MRELLFVIVLLYQGNEVFAGQPGFPWKQGDNPPKVAGVTLGMSREKLRQILGEPTQVQILSEDSLAMVFERQGIMAIWSTLDGVAIVYVQNRDAADIGGVRVGDRKADVLRRWGTPTVAQGTTMIYSAGAWGVVMRMDEENLVIQLGIGLLIP